MELDTDTILHRQSLFCSSLKSYFLRKITKYQNILLNSGIHLTQHSCDKDDILSNLNENQTFEDHVELILGQSSAAPSACKTIWKIGNRISAIKLFQWIYQIVQRTKATRVLGHVDGVSNEEIAAVILSVGQELAVAYEYQLSLLVGDSEVTRLACHAGACFITYLNSSDADFTPENLLQAVLEVKPHSTSNKEILKTRPVIYNGQSVCPRWRLSRVLKQAGLRIQLETEQPTAESSSNGGNEIEVKQLLHKEIEHDSSKEGLKKTSEQPGLGVHLEMTQKENSSEQSGDGINLNMGQARSSGNNGGDEIKVKQNSIEAVDGHSSCERLDNNSDTLSDIEALDSVSKDISKDLVNLEDDKEINRVSRTISEIDMDFENGTMTVTRHNLETRNLYAVSVDESQLGDTDFLSVKEESELENNFGTDNTSSNSFSSGKFEFKKQNLGDTCSLDLESKAAEKKVFKNCGQDSNPDELSDTEKDLDLLVHSSTSDLMNNIENLKCNSFCEGQTIDQSLCNMNCQNPVDLRNVMCKRFDREAASNVYTMCNTPEHLEGEGEHNITANPNEKLCNNITQSNEFDTNKHIRYKENTYHDIPCGLLSNVGDEIKSDDFVKIDKVIAKSSDSQKLFRFYGCFTPFGARCRPQVYGYRGPLHVWSDKERRYTLIYNDTVTISAHREREIPNNREDVHQTYVPKTFCQHVTPKT